MTLHPITRAHRPECAWLDFDLARLPYGFDIAAKMRATCTCPEMFARINTDPLRTCSRCGFWAFGFETCHTCVVLDSRIDSRRTVAA